MVSKKIKITSGLTAGIFLIVISGIILLAQVHPFFMVNHPFCLICVNPNFQDNIFRSNNLFTQKYVNEINSNGKVIISTELDKVAEVNTSDAKLNEIFIWEMTDWHNPNWEIGNFYYFCSVENLI